MRTKRTTRARGALLCSVALAVGLSLVVTGPAPATAGERETSRPTTIALPDGLRPEGIESGPGTTAYVGSLADGRILTGDLRTGDWSVLLPGADGRQVRGLFRDPRSGLLWVAGNTGTTAQVWAVDSASGAVSGSWVVPGGVFLNDLVVTRDAVWVTDSRVDRLTRIGLDRRGHPTGGPTYLALGGDWPTGLTGNRANGIRALDRHHVVLSHSTAGDLWSVDLRTGAATRLPGSEVLAGGDGVERRGRTLYVVRGTSQTSVSVLRLTRTRDGWSTRYVGELTDPSLDVPSTATVAGGSVWAVNARFGVASPGTASYWVTRLPLRP